MKHSQATKVHAPYSWTYANEAARTGATGFISEDIGKLAWQQDDNTLWFLVATTPTWQALVGAHTHTEAQVTDLDHTDTDALHVDVSGEINALTQKVTHVDADLIVIEDSEASFAKKKITLGNFPTGWVIGSTPPTAVAGLGWFNTNDGVLYIYDGTRSKWLSATRSLVSFGRGGNADGQFLRAVGTVEGTGTGYTFPYDATVVAVAANAFDGQNNKGFSIYIGGISAGSYNLVTYKYSSATLNLDVTSGDRVALYVSDVDAGVGDLVVNVELAWRYTP